jgi:hypothetical protein
MELASLMLVDSNVRALRSYALALRSSRRGRLVKRRISPSGKFSAALLWKSRSRCVLVDLDWGLPLPALHLPVGAAPGSSIRVADGAQEVSPLGIIYQATILTVPFHSRRFQGSS